MTSNLLSCYYIDEPLADDELLFVQQALIGPWSKFKTRAAALAQKRVPFVVPLPDADGHYRHSREHRADQVRHNLQHAGIRCDCGRQVVWIAPRDNDWDAIFQFAIREETGIAPYVVQRWYSEQGAPQRNSLRVVDTEMLIQGL